MLWLVGILMALTVQRFIVAIGLWPFGGYWGKKDDTGRDHCEKVFAILVVALAVVLK
jgi:hypothetical protein